MNSIDQWGPFAPDLEPAERRARLRALRALAHLHLGPRGAELVQLLHRAERADDLLEPAVAQLEALPALDRRRILASYAAISSPATFAPARRTPTLRVRPVPRPRARSISGE